MKGNKQMQIIVGDYITLVMGTTELRGQCVGFRIDQDGELSQVFIDGFPYAAFEIGQQDYKWKVGEPVA